MPSINILYGHELSDLCDEDKIFEAADLNGIGITDVLIPGVTLSVPTVSKKDLTRETVKPRVKPNTVVAVPGQTWIDLVLQQLGDEERIFELCDDNDVGITDDLIAGTVINSPMVTIEKSGIVKALTLRKPASMFFGIDDPAPEGIEYWAIELDFEVS